MKGKNSWLIVTNKATYLFLLSIPVGFIKIYLDYGANLNSEGVLNIARFVQDTFISCIIIALGIIFFVKFNTHSHWMNPDHPKPQQEDHH